jgi:hypothetical protein
MDRLVQESLSFMISLNKILPVRPCCLVANANIIETRGSQTQEEERRRFYWIFSPSSITNKQLQQHQQQ